MARKKKVQQEEIVYNKPCDEVDSFVVRDRNYLITDIRPSQFDSGYMPETCAGTGKDITCTRCGEMKLVWGRVQGQFRLFDKDGEIHSCYPMRKKY